MTSRRRGKREVVPQSNGTVEIRESDRCVILARDELLYQRILAELRKRKVGGPYVHVTPKEPE